MAQIALFLSASLGLLAALVFGISDLHRFDGYPLVTHFLLAIGLFASAASIDLDQARAHKRIIFSAISVGVIAKAAITGIVLSLVFGDPIFFLLGVVLAQIDPLAVAAIQRKTRFSARARTILASWASFDDPVTVVLTVSAVSVISGEALTVWPLLGDLGANAIFVVVAWLGWRLVSLAGKHAAIWECLLVGGLIIVATWQLTMVGLAIAALFIRPAPVLRCADGVARGALLIASFLLGIVIAAGADLVAGVTLGVVAFGAHMVVGSVLTRGLPTVERAYLALAQQNGITAIILALTLEPDFVGVVAVVAPAIVVINVCYAVSNHFLSRSRVSMS